MPMGARLRTTLVVISTIMLAACGDVFMPMTGSGSGGSSSSAGGGGSGAGAGGATTTSTSGGGGSGGTGTAGSGGSTCDQNDDDGDGYSECQGDCDDTNGFVSPGAVEVCGDEIDENCDGINDSDAESPCQGIGTFVSLSGNFGASGTMDDPVPTIEEGIEHAMKIGVPTAVRVSAGIYLGSPVLVDSISLIGGYDPDNWLTRAPETYVTTIKNDSLAGLQIVGAVAPLVVDGFTIEGRQVTMMNDGSTAAVTIDGGSPTLSKNLVVAGPVNAGSGQSVGVNIVSTSGIGGEPTLRKNTVTSATAKDGESYGVHIAADSMSLILEGNFVTAGKGTNSIALFIEEAGAEVVARENHFQSGPAIGSMSPSASFGVWVKDSSVVFDSNVVNQGQSGDAAPTCFTPGAWCGGVRVSAGGGIFTNNLVYGASTDLSAGIQLVEDHESLAGVIINSNLVLATGRATASSISTAILLGSPMPDAGPTFVGQFRNNIFWGGDAQKNYGFFEQLTANESCNPAFLDHNLFFFPKNAPFNGILYLDWDGMVADDLTQLDQLPGDGDNHLDDPLLSGAQITADSPCRNAGTGQDAPLTDFEHETRPQERANDIGPDEFSPPG
jgi:hypothetical protein